MKLEQAQNLILGAANYFERQSQGYENWGQVHFLQMAVRLDDRQILVSHPEKPLSEQTEKDFKILPLKGESYFQKMLFWNWNCKIALLTQQEFASQVSETIPPILDDQAQLLGVNIKISNNPAHAVWNTIGRYTTILSNGQSLCIGKTLEDVFVASQLLEKTSKAWILGKLIGGAKSINIVEAWIMQQFYLLKYSKQAEQNK